jgi:hypothetical protein
MLGGGYKNLENQQRKNNYIARFWVKPFSKGLQGLGRSPKVLGRKPVN